jgi:hypothetical protein
MRRFAVIALCLSMGCGIVVGVYCWSVFPSPAVSRALAAKVHLGPGTIIDFAQIAPFAWDKVFVFHPYTSKERIDRCLGFRWDSAEWSVIDSFDGANLVVFVRNGAVVCWFDHSRSDGDLMDLADGKGYTRQEAIFRVCLDQEQRLVLAK